ncbi:MAG: GPP34 family phosphoprotein [Gemmatimonadetes bacterium]|nr:GPP34 family phosphoprotein [Gemmatimonadota bacterium]
MSRRELYFYEEIMLLALRDQEGTVAANDASFAFTLGGSLLAELLLMGKVSVEELKKKKLVNLENSSRTGDPLLDECLEKLRDAKRRATLNTWVSRFARLKKLRHRAAQQLCRRGILRADEGKVLLIFTRKIYPELDSGPERELVERLRNAIFTEAEELDPRTVVLVALSDKAGVLKNHFDKKELKARKARIEKIGEGEVTAAAVKEVVDAMTAAIAASVAASAAVSAAT